MEERPQASYYVDESDPDNTVVSLTPNSSATSSALSNSLFSNDRATVTPFSAPSNAFLSLLPFVQSTGLS